MAPDELHTAFAHAREPGMTGPQPQVPQSPQGAAAPGAAPLASAAAPIGYPTAPEQTGPQGIQQIQALPASAQAQQLPSPQALQAASALPAAQASPPAAASPVGPVGPAPTAQQQAATGQHPAITGQHPAVTGQQRAQSPKPALAQFLETFDMPALLRSRTLGILAANRSGSQLYAPVLQWSGGHGQHVNLLEFALVGGETARGFWPDWPLVVSTAISELSLMAEQHPDDPEVISTVGALMTASRDFGRMWSETTPQRLANEGTETINHPLLGLIELPYRILYMDDDGSHVVVYAPVPGSSAHTAIKRLSE